jgi:hypothetical protein
MCEISERKEARDEFGSEDYNIVVLTLLCFSLDEDLSCRCLRMMIIQQYKDDEEEQVAMIMVRYNLSLCPLLEGGLYSLSHKLPCVWTQAKDNSSSGERDVGSGFHFNMPHTCLFWVLKVVALPASEDGRHSTPKERKVLGTYGWVFCNYRLPNGSHA